MLHQHTYHQTDNYPTTIHTSMPFCSTPCLDVYPKSTKVMIQENVFTKVFIAGLYTTSGANLGAQQHVNR